MRPERPLEWAHDQGERLRVARLARRSQEQAGRFEAVCSDPGALTRRLMRGFGPLLPAADGGSAVRALNGGTRDEPGVAARWWAACVALLILGFALWGIGWVLGRLFGGGALLMLVGALMWTLASVGILITPLLWMGEMAAGAVREGRGHGDLRA